MSASVIYRGYVDDPRNTDNAWVETTCYHFHWCTPLVPVTPTLTPTPTPISPGGWPPRG